MPIAFAALGARNQTLIDLHPNARVGLVNNTLRRITPLLRDLDVEAQDFDSSPINGIEDLHQRFGITYVAPADARATSLAAGAIDVITSTYTLEHIPADDIEAILDEATRILRDGGLFSAMIDLQDHYSWFDPSIGKYNFLRFSDRAWALINSSVHYQNRLRQSDYSAMLERTDLEQVYRHLDRPTAEDLASLASAPWRRAFADVTRSIAIRETFVVLRRPQRVA